MEQLNLENAFTIFNEQGIEVTCDVIAIIEQEDQNPLIVYTDYSLDENDEFNVFVSELEESGDSYNLIEATNYENIEEVKQSVEEAIHNFKNLDNIE